MARHNFVMIYGFCRQQALVAGDGSQALCPVTIVRSSRDKNFQQVVMQKKYSTPIIVTEDPQMVDEIATWRENDIVIVKGYIATRDIDKETSCPECQFLNRRIDAVVNAKSGGNLIYVSPIFAEKITSFPNQDMAFENIRCHEEISNIVYLVGNLVSDPIKGVHYFKVNGSDKVIEKYFTRYQLAINRKYYPRGISQIHERTDFPWVYAYGENADNDFKALKAGSKVFVDGALQTRSYSEDYICQNCGKKYHFKGKTLEVVSYATEYLENYDEIEVEEESIY